MRPAGVEADREQGRIGEPLDYTVAGAGRLAARLKENGADLEGWLRLIKSYAVLKEAGKAQEAAASARAQFASDPGALEQIDRLVLGLGLPRAGAKEGAPKS